ncbi:MAG: hypothetical protein AB1646_06865 [Thermodesulfobacteriota bacterium]
MEEEKAQPTPARMEAEAEERALSVFQSERNEDITAMIFTFAAALIVLILTKWV